MGHIFRAFVMLACLAVVPIVAIYGKQIQEFGRAVLETYRARFESKAAAAPAMPSGTATLQSAPPAGSADPMLSASPWDNPPSREPNTLPAMSAEAGSTQRALSDNRGSNGVPSGQSGGQPSGTASSLNREAADGVQQAGFFDATGAAKNSAGTGIAGDSSGSSVGGVASTVQFRRIEHRLRELGATYYLLETWGPSGDRYRFYCRMAIAGNSDYGRNRVFQDTNSDPLQAMQSVLDQAEQWRSGRQP